MGSEAVQLGMHVLGNPPVVQAASEKLWEITERVKILVERSEMDTGEVESLLGSLTWLVLPVRPALAIFCEIFHFVLNNRGAGVVEIPPSIKREL
eukprot:13217965-Alexandrium_andersonii.AAC.1